MKYLFIMLLLATTLFSLTNAEKAYISKKAEIYELEWDQCLSNDDKLAIIKNYLKGNMFNIGWSAAGATFIESRGNTNKVNANVVNSGLASLDCGTMGSNTYYYLKYRGIESPTLYQQVDACHELNKDPNKSFLHFINVMSDAMDNKYIASLKGTSRYWSHIWNYYNTGSPTVLKGSYYLDMHAAITMLKNKIIITKINISKINRLDNYVLDNRGNDTKQIAIALEKWKH